MNEEPQRYFGEAWASGICDDGLRVAAPRDTLCVHCGEGFAEGDRGYYLNPAQAVHLECGMRMVIGSVGHLRRQCPCYGGVEEDPPGLSKREAAEAAYIEHQRQERQRLITMPRHARN